MSIKSIQDGFSGNTEFLTDGGWKKLSDFEPSDRSVEWISDFETRFVDDVVVSKSDGVIPLVHYYNSTGLDLLISKNQMVTGLTERGSRIDKIINPEKIGRTRMINSFNTPSTSEVELSDADLLLYIACCADGSVLKRKDNPDRLVIRIKKDRKKQRIVKLLEASNTKYIRRSCEPEGFEVFVFDPPYVTKDMSVFWKCSDRQLKLIYDEIPYWDGCFAKGLTPKGEVRKYQAPMFFSSIKDEADLVQYVFTTAVNRRASICTLDRVGVAHSDKPKYKYKSIEYTVRSTNLKYSTMRRCDIKLVDPAMVYNMNVPYWVARYNGAIFIAKGL